MEEVVCAERSGFPFGPGAWPEFWTLLFLSLATPLAVRGARCERVGSRFGASGSLSRPARVPFMDNPAFRPDSEGWKLIDNERIRGNSPPVRSRSGLPELECWKPGGSPTRGSRLSHLRTLVGSVSLQHVCGK